MRSALKVLLIDIKMPGEKRFVNDVGLGLLYIAGYAMKQLGNIQIKVINCKLSEELRKYEPEIVGVSYTTPYKKYADAIIKEVKEYGIKTIVGGPHITLMPQHLGQADVGVIGEGEFTVVELMESYRDNRWSEKFLEKIEGIIFRKEDGTIIQTPSRKPIEYLDNLGHPARWLAAKSYNTANTLISSRGCPFNCSFCCAKTLWPGKIRFHSVGFILEEIEYLYNSYGSLEIAFMDDMFAYNPKQLEEFSNEYIKQTFSKKISLGCNCRAEKIDINLVEVFKKINIKHVFLGLESGNDEILKFLKGPTSSVAQNYQAVSLLLKNNINVTAGIIIGAPQETSRHLQDTYEMLSLFKGLNFETFFLTPLPATPIWKYAEEEKLISDGIDFAHLDGSRPNVMLNKSLSSDVLISWKKKFDTLSLKRKAHSKIVHRLGLIKDIIFHPKKAFTYFQYRLRRPRSSHAVKEDVFGKFRIFLEKFLGSHSNG